MSRRALVLAATFGQFFTITPALARDVTFFVMACPHHNGARTTTIIEAMNALPGAAYPDAYGTVDVPRGVIIAGDLTNDNTQFQWDAFVADYGLTGTDGLLNYPVYEGRGNHDDSEYSTVVADGVTARHGGLTYAWDWDDVHIVCCDVYVNAEVSAWLASHMQTVPLDKPVILFHHIGMPTLPSAESFVLAAGGVVPQHTPEDEDAYEAAIKNHNVLAIFHGHNHRTAHYDWRGYDVYLVTSPLVEEPGFAAVHITDDEMLVSMYTYTYDGPTLTGGYWDWHHVKSTAHPPVELKVHEINGAFGSIQLDPPPADPNLPEYAVGTEVTLTATPEPGYELKHWRITIPTTPATPTVSLSMSRILRRSS